MKIKSFKEFNSEIRYISDRIFLDVNFPNRKYQIFEFLDTGVINVFKQCVIR